MRQSQTRTVRSSEARDRLSERSWEIHLFDGTAPLDNAASALKGTTHLIDSAPPSANGDPVLLHHGRRARHAWHHHGMLRRGLRRLLRVALELHAVRGVQCIAVDHVAIGDELQQTTPALMMPGHGNQEKTFQCPYSKFSAFLPYTFSRLGC